MIKASFVLTENEAAYLLSAAEPLSDAARCIVLRYLTETCSEEEARAGLMAKQWAREDFPPLTLEPTVDFLLREIASARRFWMAANALIIQTNRLWIAVTRYRYAEKTCRVTPYPNRAALTAALREGERNHVADLC